jgi:hypothetical protein
VEVFEEYEFHYNLKDGEPEIYDKRKDLIKERGVHAVYSTYPIMSKESIESQEKRLNSH